MDNNKKEKGQRRYTVERLRKKGLMPAAEQGCRKEKAGRLTGSRPKVSSGSDASSDTGSKASGEAGGDQVHVASFSLVLMTLPRFLTFWPSPLEWEPSVCFLLCSSPSRAKNRSDAGSRQTENRKSAMHFSSTTMDTRQPITKGLSSENRKQNICNAFFLCYHGLITCQLITTKNLQSKLRI